MTNQLDQDYIDTEDQRSIIRRITFLGSASANKKSRKAFFVHYSKRYLQAFAQFIDNPHCHNSNLHILYFAQSILKPLQRRQRITAVKVITALFCYLDVETLRIGVANQFHLDTVTHNAIREKYKECWNADISKTRYDAMINILKLAHLLTVDPIFVTDDELPTEESSRPKIYSKAAYKEILPTFIYMFPHLAAKKDVQGSYVKAIAIRISKGLSVTWFTYLAFSYSYFRTRRNLAKAYMFRQAYSPDNDIPIPT